MGPIIIEMGVFPLYWVLYILRDASVRWMSTWYYAVAVAAIIWLKGMKSKQVALLYCCNAVRVNLPDNSCNMQLIFN